MSVGYFVDAESPILSYHGSGWLPMLSTNANAPLYNNKTGMYTNITGDSMSISFFGTGISLYGPRLTTHGSFNATLDGVTAMGSSYSQKDEWATLFYTSPNVTQGSHQFVITNAPTNSSTILGVDYVIVQDSASPFPADQHSLFVDDTDKSIFTYLPSSSSWESTPDTQSLGGSLLRTQSQAGALEVRFTGLSIALYGRVGQSNAQYLCSMDGGPNVSYTEFWVESASQQTLYFANNLTGGGAEHVLRVWNEPDVSKGHIWLEVDYVQLWGSDGLPAQQSSHGGRTAAIVGGVVGGLLFILCSALGFYIIQKRRRNASSGTVAVHDDSSTQPQQQMVAASFSYDTYRSTEHLSSFPPTSDTTATPTILYQPSIVSAEDIRPMVYSRPPTYQFSFAPDLHPHERNTTPQTVGQEHSPAMVSAPPVPPIPRDLRQATPPGEVQRAEDAGLLMTDRDLELRTLGRRTPGPGSPALPDYASAWRRSGKF